MAKIIKKHGNLVLFGAKLSRNAHIVLDSNEVVKVDIIEIDERKMSDDQRKFIFALCKEFEKCTGNDSEMFRANCMVALDEVFGIEKKTLKQYTVSDANKLIDVIIGTLIRMDIPISGHLLAINEYQFNQSQIYMMCLKRICCVCGKKADIHHVDAVGMGRNRKTISHIGMRVIPICRDHHIESHQIGDNAFLKKYHLNTIKIDEKLEFFIKKGKIKEFIHEGE